MNGYKLPVTRALLVAFLLREGFMAAKNIEKVYVCSNCQFTGRGKRPGSNAIEVILWLCYLVPGIFYSLWRNSKKEKICPQCGAKPMVPFNTVRGKEISLEAEGDVVRKIQEANASYRMAYIVLLSMLALTILYSVVATQF
jgi:predicted RNA-binding Zn-ribbon protein involved in translation (DUF1610 family)